MKARANRHRSERSTVLKITEEGALFRSYRDGRKVLLTPESSVQAQKGACVCICCAAAPVLKRGGREAWGRSWIFYQPLHDRSRLPPTPQPTARTSSSPSTSCTPTTSTATPW